MARAQKAVVVHPSGTRQRPLAESLQSRLGRDQLKKMMMDKCKFPVRAGTSPVSTRLYRGTVSCFVGCWAPFFVEVKPKQFIISVWSQESLICASPMAEAEYPYKLEALGYLLISSPHWRV